MPGRPLSLDPDFVPDVAEALLSAFLSAPLSSLLKKPCSHLLLILSTRLLISLPIPLHESHLPGPPVNNDSWKLPACRQLFSLAVSQLLHVQLVVCERSREAAHGRKLENRLASILPFPRDMFAIGYTI